MEHVEGTMRTLILAALAFWIAPISSHALTIEQEQMLRELESIRNTFKAQYAPTEWKKKYLKWDLDQAIELAKTEVVSNDTKIPDFRKVLSRFFNSMKDYH